MEQAVFGAGCFWGVEASFKKLQGVVATYVGYSGGDINDPSYKQVCTDATGHAEVVVVTYDPQIISFKKLVEAFFDLHGPTTLNRQGVDVGSQYRSVIFYETAEERQIAEEVINILDVSGKFSAPIVTSLEPKQTVWRAEDYHQNYLEKNQGCGCG